MSRSLPQRGILGLQGDEKKGRRSPVQTTMSYYRRFRRKSILSSAVIIGSIFLLLRLLSCGLIPLPGFSKSGQSQEKALGSGNRGDGKKSSIAEDISWTPVPCRELPGANDTLVILRSGATELKDKLPVHFHTTLPCYPNYMLFSDHEETLEGHHILDALESVDPETKKSHPDFELWRRLQEHGRSALTADELSGPDSRVSPMTGKKTNPGWKLDKWKFLPMVTRTLSEYPDMKWYIFVETDTYMFWSTALAWTSGLDYTRPWYMGSQMQIGDVIFGHGGSGFIASQAALRMVVDWYKADQVGWERYTDSHWAGDCVLGRAFKESGAPLAWSWPTIQGVKPSALSYDRYDYGKRLWCHPAMSYHHMSPSEVEDVWNFEQRWIRDEHKVIKHKDVFRYYILPHIKETKGRKAHWDNMSGTVLENVKSLNECRSKCKEIPDCVQYAFLNGVCSTSDSPHWGESNPYAESGWYIDRVERFMNDQSPCEDESWVTG